MEDNQQPLQRRFRAAAEAQAFGFVEVYAADEKEAKAKAERAIAASDDADLDWEIVALCDLSESAYFEPFLWTED